MKKILSTSITLSLIFSFIFFLPQKAYGQGEGLNLLSFCSAVYKFLQQLNATQPPTGDDNTYPPPFGEASGYGAWLQYVNQNLYQTQLTLAQCNNLYQKDPNSPIPDEAKTALTDFIQTYCTPNYLNANFSLRPSFVTLCETWSNPTEKNQYLTNLYNNPISYTPGNNPNYLIAQEKAGEEIGEELAQNRASNCTPDQPNLGLIDFFKNPLGWFLRLIFWILHFIMEFLADAFVFLLTPQNFGGFVNFSPVKQIWKTSRDLANLGIILGFVIMALTTILKIEKYSWEKILWRLVLVALLINFSLVICGIFVDISNFLTIYFITGASNQTLSFKTILSYVTAKITCSGLTAQGFWYEFATALLGVIVTVVFIGQLIGLILYVVIRIVTLWITLGLSPLFFLSLAFPGLEKIANTWRDYFTQAIVSLPIIALSFLVVLIMLNAVATEYFLNVASGEFTKVIIAIIAYAVIIMVLSQAVLAIAGALGIQQIQNGYKWGTGAVWGALGFLAGSAYKGTAREVVKSQAWEQTAKRLEESGNRMLYRIGRTMSETRARMIGEKIKGEEEYLSKQDPVQTRNYIKRNASNPDLVALGVNRLIELGQLGVDDQPYVDIASKSPYFRPPPDSRKNNFVVYGRSLVEDDKKLEYLNNAQKTLSQYQNYGIDPNAIQALGDENLVLFDIASTLKASDIEQQNWDNIWEKYLNTLSKQQRDTFLFGLVLSQGTKLAIIDQTARSHRIDIGKAIVDATYNHLKKLEPTAKLEDAVNFLLEDKVTIGKKVIVGLGGKINTGFKNWIITSSGI